MLSSRTEFLGLLACPWSVEALASHTVALGISVLCDNGSVQPELALILRLFTFKNVFIMFEFVIIHQLIHLWVYVSFSTYSLQAVTTFWCCNVYWT